MGEGSAPTDELTLEEAALCTPMRLRGIAVGGVDIGADGFSSTLPISTEEGRDEAGGGLETFVGGGRGWVARAISASERGTRSGVDIEATLELS